MVITGKTAAREKKGMRKDDDSKSVSFDLRSAQESQTDPYRKK